MINTYISKEIFLFFLSHHLKIATVQQDSDPLQFSNFKYLSFLSFFPYLGCPFIFKKVHLLLTFFEPPTFSNKGENIVFCMLHHSYKILLLMLLVDVICVYLKETTSGESNQLATQNFEFDQFMKNTLLHVFQLAVRHF